MSVDMTTPSGEASGCGGRQRSSGGEEYREGGEGDCVSGGQSRGSYSLAHPKWSPWTSELEFFSLGSKSSNGCNDDEGGDDGSEESAHQGSTHLEQQN